MSEEDLKFRGYKDAKKFIKNHRIRENRFLRVHGKRIKVKTLKEEKPRGKNWTVNVGKLDKGAMKALGYSYTDSATKRRTALRKGLKIYGYSDLMHKLNFMLINKNKVPKMYKVVREDIDWLKTKK